MAKPSRKRTDQVMKAVDDVLQVLGIEPHDPDGIRTYIEEMLLSGHSADDIIGEVRLVSAQQLLYESYLTEPAQEHLVEALTGRKQQ